MSLRALDANFNRAREALRVVEDAARFELSDAGLSAELKRLRHELDALARPHAREFLAARDASGDVGADGDVAEPQDLVAANFKRAGEAMRSIEEHAKVRFANLARAVTRLRFRLYGLEQRMQSPRAQVVRARLYVLLDSSVTSLPLERAAREALRGGASMLQLREEGSDKHVLELARRLVPIARDAKALFLVNDRIDVALAAGADGVHVGLEDLPVEQARRLVGASRIVGATSHSLSEAKSAAAAGADYISVGPMFATSLKPGLAARGFSYLAAARKIGLPHFCIGGITSSNVDRSMERVAVCSGVIAQRDPAAAARAILRELDRQERQEDAKHAKGFLGVNLEHLRE